MRFRKKNLLILLVFGSYISVIGLLTTSRYIEMIRPYTDNMKVAVNIFKTTGKFPARQRIGLGVDKYKLDWSFGESQVDAYLKRGKKTLFYKIKNFF